MAMATVKIALAISIVALLLGAFSTATVFTLQGSISELSGSAEEISGSLEALRGELSELRDNIDLLSKGTGIPLEPGVVAKLVEERERVEAAKKEGVLNVIFYPAYRPLVEAFEEKYGIRVEAKYVGAPEIIRQLKTEAEAGVFTVDLFATTSPFPPLYPLNVEWGDSYTSDTIKKVEQYYINNLAEDEKGKVFPISIEAVGVSYNEKLVAPEDVPTSIFDLLDPKWKGKILARTPWLGTSFTFAQGSYFVYFDQDEAKWRDYHLKLKANLVRYEPSWGTLHTSVSAGEFSMAIFSLSQAAWPNLKFTSFREGMLWFYDAISIHKMAKHKNAARLFIDYALSDEGQRVLAEVLIPINPNIEPVREDHRKVLEQFEFVDSDYVAWVLAEAPNTEKWVERIQAIYK